MISCEGELSRQIDLRTVYERAAMAHAGAKEENYDAGVTQNLPSLPKLGLQVRRECP